MLPIIFKNKTFIPATIAIYDLNSINNTGFIFHNCN